MKVSTNDAQDKLFEKKIPLDKKSKKKKREEKDYFAKIKQYKKKQGFCKRIKLAIQARKRRNDYTLGENISMFTRKKKLDDLYQGFTL